jgi:MFS-type transporter involved in bile tolerance (Atg22 family)
MQKKNRGQILSWCLFDFANSSYSAVIAAVVFPVYYVSVIVGDRTGLGDLWWGRAISLSMAFVAITSPFLGGIADYSGRRKQLLLVYTLLSVACVSALSFLKQGMVIEGFLLVMAANIGMEGGLVFYNSFLPEIAEKEFQGRVSAWGYAVGYAGSIASLLCALLLSPIFSPGLSLPRAGQEEGASPAGIGDKRRQLFMENAENHLGTAGGQKISVCVPHLRRRHQHGDRIFEHIRSDYAWIWGE